MHYRSSQVCSLGGWSPQLPTGFPVPRGTQEVQRESRSFCVQGCHLLWRPVPGTFCYDAGLFTPCGRLSHPPLAPTTPVVHRSTGPLSHRRFRLFPVRSPLLGESRLISLPPGTEMFQFPGFPPPGVCVQPEVPGDKSGRVAPFGYPRLSLLDDSPRLIAALLRPSSARDAKASTARPL